MAIFFLWLSVVSCCALQEHIKNKKCKKICKMSCLWFFYLTRVVNGGGCLGAIHYSGQQYNISLSGGEGVD